MPLYQICAVPLYGLCSLSHSFCTVSGDGEELWTGCGFVLSLSWLSSLWLGLIWLHAKCRWTDKSSKFSILCTVVISYVYLSMLIRLFC